MQIDFLLRDRHRNYRNKLIAISWAIAANMSFLSCQKKRDTSSLETNPASRGVTLSSGGDGDNLFFRSKAKTADDSTVTALTTELTLSSSLSIVPAKKPSSVLNTMGTEYDEDPSHIYVQDEALSPLVRTSNIYCLLSKLGYVQMVNKGKYIAQVKERECFNQKGETSAKSDIQQRATEYSSFIVESTRDDGKPIKISMWLSADGEQDSESGDEYNLHAKLQIAEGVSKKNPMGIFKLNWIEKQNTSGGFLESYSDENGDLVVSMTELTQRENNKFEVALGAILSRDPTSEEIIGGKMTTKTSDIWENHVNNSEYKFVFNNDRMLRISGSADEKCYNRDEFYLNAWSYKLYEKDTGKRVKIHAGIPLEYKTSQNRIIRAHIGYHGLWTEGNEHIPTGATVSRITDDNTNLKNDYNIIRSNGRLIKSTRIPLNIDDIIGVDLDHWDKTIRQQVRIVYNGIKFHKSALFEQTDQGGKWVENKTEEYTLSDGQHWFWAEHLGDVMIAISNHTVTQVNITSTEDVTGTAGNLSLSCIIECPLASISNEMVSGTINTTPFSPDRESTALTDAVIYTYDQSMLRLKRAGAMVDLQENANLNLSQRYRGRLRSGPLIPSNEATSLLAFSNAKVFYTWETGQENWHRYTGIRDSLGKILEFEAPIQFTYTHRLANDADGRGKDFDNRKIRLTYAGPGHLWGIPREKVHQGRNAPLFSISSGTILGPDNRFLIKIIEGEQRMKEATSCSGLTISGTPSLPQKNDFKSFTWSDPPSHEDLNVEVIDGEALTE